MVPHIMGRIILAFITKFPNKPPEITVSHKTYQQSIPFPNSLDSFPSRSVFQRTHSAKNEPIQEPSHRSQPNLPHRRRPPSTWHSPTCRSPRGRTARWACTASGGRSTPGPRGRKGHPASCPLILSTTMFQILGTHFDSVLYFSRSGIFSSSFC